MKLGIVGLPNVGKSTLFNSMTTGKAEAANYPFCTIDPNVGVVPVPDARLTRLTEIYGSQRTLPAVIEFVDIAGLVRGASKGEGLGNKFLSHIREVDAICHVVRCFEDTNVVSSKQRNNQSGTDLLRYRSSGQKNCKNWQTGKTGQIPVERNGYPAETERCAGRRQIRKNSRIR